MNKLTLKTNLPLVYDIKIQKTLDNNDINIYYFKYKTLVNLNKINLVIDKIEYNKLNNKIILYLNNKIIAKTITKIIGNSVLKEKYISNQNVITNDVLIYCNELHNINDNLFFIFRTENEYGYILKDDIDMSKFMLVDELIRTKNEN